MCTLVLFNVRSSKVWSDNAQRTVHRVSFQLQDAACGDNIGFSSTLAPYRSHIVLGKKVYRAIFSTATRAHHVLRDGKDANDSGSRFRTTFLYTGVALPDQNCPPCRLAIHGHVAGV